MGVRFVLKKAQLSSNGAYLNIYNPPPEYADIFEEKRVQWQEMLASKTVKFEESELLALQTYFLIIDIQDSGKIGVDDLVRWTKDEGGFVVEDHAQMALDIIDFDKDGYIGFEDFLVFSAAAKRIWMAEQLDLFKG
eukprot:snap_masked-scaffold_23-processed-gene-2.8-mRNA-1 protein AED:1.00 eAED:1.00 QI:0/0/0/0/1/1/2/0/135